MICKIGHNKHKELTNYIRSLIDPLVVADLDVQHHPAHLSCRLPPEKKFSLFHSITNGTSAEKLL